MKPLDEIKARAEAATPGPWDIPSIADGIRHLDRNEWWYGEEAECNVPGRQGGDGGLRDANFIAHAPTDIPRLVKALEYALGALSACRSRLGDSPMMTLLDESEVAAILAGEDEE